MLYSFFGNNVGEVRAKAFAFLHTLESENKTARMVTADDWEDGLISNLAGGTSLFGGTEIIVLDTLSGAGEGVFESVLDNLDLLAGSENQFVLIEEKVLAAEKRQIEKFSEKVVEIVGEKEERFNAFLLADALSQRDRKSLWLLLNEAWREGVENEQIVGLLFWQVKMLRLAARTKSAEEAGQKSFPYQKAKRALQNFKEGDVDRLSRELVLLYHEGHAGKVDMSLSLEKWILTI